MNLKDRILRLENGLRIMNSVINECCINDFLELDGQINELKARISLLESRKKIKSN
jgi:hypothetical protein